MLHCSELSPRSLSRGKSKTRRLLRIGIVDRLFPQVETTRQDGLPHGFHVLQSFLEETKEVMTLFLSIIRDFLDGPPEWKPLRLRNLRLCPSLFSVLTMNHAFAIDE